MGPRRRTRLGSKMGTWMGTWRLLGSSLLGSPLCGPALSLLCSAPCHCSTAVACLCSAGAATRGILFLVLLPERSRLLSVCLTVSGRLGEGGPFPSGAKPIGVMVR